MKVSLLLLWAPYQFASNAFRAYEHCAIPREISWQVVILERSLTELLISKTTGLEQLNVEAEHVNDAWFKNSYGDLKLCRV